MTLGEEHIYKYPTASTVYRSGPFDPEGIIGKISVVEEVYKLAGMERIPMNIGGGRAECFPLSDPVHLRPW
jgi:hypothetical protein